jgi:hypothetical protein
LRIPRLEADVLDRQLSTSSMPTGSSPADQLRNIQCERRIHERRELKDDAAILELHKHKGIPWDPADHGFVLSKDQVELCSERVMRQNEARTIAYVRFDLDPNLHKNLVSSSQ